MIHVFCAPSEQLQETSCFSNQASLGLLMVMSSEVAHRPGTGSGSVAAAWGADGQLPPSLDGDHKPTQRCAGAPNGSPAPHPASPCSAFCPLGILCHLASWVFWGSGTLVDTCHTEVTQYLYQQRGRSSLAGAARGGMAGMGWQRWDGRGGMVEEGLQRWDGRDGVAKVVLQMLNCRC